MSPNTKNMHTIFLNITEEKNANQRIIKQSIQNQHQKHSPPPIAQETQDYHPVLFIPRVAKEITEKQIQSVFHEIQLGKIKRIDLVPVHMKTAPTVHPTAPPTPNCNNQVQSSAFPTATIPTPTLTTTPTPTTTTTTNSSKSFPFQKAFIHFHQWYVNENSNYAKERLEKGQDIKIIYDEKSQFFWKITEYKPNEYHSSHYYNPHNNNKYNQKESNQKETKNKILYQK